MSMSMSLSSRASIAAVLAIGAAAACGSEPRPMVVDGEPSDADTTDAEPPAFIGAVYVHSYFKLFKVDPDTLMLTEVGPFQWPVGYESEMMTDLAVDKDMNLTGISFGAVYSVDRNTAECTFLSNLSGSFVGLSFLPTPADPEIEILIGTTQDGSVWEIDKTNGNSTMVGDFGGVMESSGDIVSVAGFGTIATVKNGSLVDYLARVDESNGYAATIIGNTNYPDIWGVGFWRGEAYGFVATNEFVIIDVTTGGANFILDGPENWTGAGVTTRAPIEP
jgi:hypothetical protein